MKKVTINVAELLDEFDPDGHLLVQKAKDIVVYVMLNDDINTYCQVINVIASNSADEEELFLLTLVVGMLMAKGYASDINLLRFTNPDVSAVNPINPNNEFAYIPSREEDEFLEGLSEYVKRFSHLDGLEIVVVIKEFCENGIAIPQLMMIMLQSPKNN